MFAPDLHARVEELNDHSIYWINRRQVGAFVAIALQARQRQVVTDGLAAMFDGDHMIYRKPSAT